MKHPTDFRALEIVQTAGAPTTTTRDTPLPMDGGGPILAPAHS